MRIRMIKPLTEKHSMEKYKICIQVILEKSQKYKYNFNQVKHCCIYNNLHMSGNFKRILPLLNRIVVRKVQPQAKTKSGIILQKADGLNYGVVLEAGPGSYDNNGKIVPLSLKIGDKVLLPEFGGTQVKLGEQELFIFRDTDIIAKLE